VERLVDAAWMQRTSARNKAAVNGKQASEKTDEAERTTSTTMTARDTIGPVGAPKRLEVAEDDVGAARREAAGLPPEEQPSYLQGGTMRTYQVWHVRTSRPPS